MEEITPVRRPSLAEAVEAATNALRLRLIRETADVTLQELSEATGGSYSPSRIRVLETGRASLSSKDYSALARALLSLLDATFSQMHAALCGAGDVSLLRFEERR